MKRYRIVYFISKLKRETKIFKIYSKVRTKLLTNNNGLSNDTTLGLVGPFKGIVKWSGRRCVSGMNWTVMTLHTIADFLDIHLKGYSRALNRTKPVSEFRAKKGERRVALQVYLKPIGDCVQSHNGSNGATLNLPLLWFYIILKSNY